MHQLFKVHSTLAKDVRNKPVNTANSHCASRLATVFEFWLLLCRCLSHPNAASCQGDVSWLYSQTSKKWV